MLRSFRLKIGLLNLCLSGLLLAAFGAFAGAALRRVGVERIDRELRALADAQVRRVQPPGHWRIFDDSLRATYGEDAPRQFVVKASRPSGEELYATPTWPAGLPRTALPLQLPSHPAFQPRPPQPSDERPAPAPREHAQRRPRPFDDTPPRDPPPPRLPVVGPVYATLAGAGSQWRAMTIANADVTLSVAMSLSGLQAETRRFRRTMLVGAPLGLLLIVSGGWLIGHVALRPVKLIALTAESVTSRSLDARIPDRQADAEFERLIALINGMLERLERSFQQATRFSADAAHELKTPLAILQARAERALQRAGDGTPEQREYAGQLDEVQRLKAIVDKLLLLSQADAGHMTLSRSRGDLAALAAAAAEDARMLAPDRRVQIDAPKPVPVSADLHLLTHIVGNLVSNAVKFGDPGGSIAICASTHAGRATLRVSNTGQPIPETDRGRVFERFFRGDPSRTRQSEGSGLGLSLAREIARAHGGDVTLESSDANGTSFALWLPALDEAGAA